jgi:hypothetical protein
MSGKSIIIKTFVTSTDPIPKYNGYSLPLEAIHDIAKKIREGQMPLGIEHSRRHSLLYRTLKSEVRKTNAGTLGVWVEIEVDEEVWKTVGDKQAFSVSVEEAYHFPDPTDTKPKITISADPAYIDEETCQAVITELEPYCAVEARHLYQLSDLSPIVIIISIASGAAGNLVSTAICGAIKKLSELKNKKEENQDNTVLIQKGNTKIFILPSDPNLKRQISRLIPSKQRYEKVSTHKQIGNRQNHQKNRKRRKSR